MPSTPRARARASRTLTSDENTPRPRAAGAVIVVPISATSTDSSPTRSRFGHQPATPRYAPASSTTAITPSPAGVAPSHQANRDAIVARSDGESSTPVIDAQWAAITGYSA